MEQEKEILEKNLQRVKEDLEDLQRYVDELTVFLPLPFCTVNPLSLILGVNQAFQELSGYGEMEVIGNSVEFLFSEKTELEKFKKEVSEKKQRVSREATLLKKNKDKVPVKITALARTDNENNFLGYFLTISDISDTKKFQEKLEQKVKEKTEEIEAKTIDLADSQKALLNILEDTEESRKQAEEEKNKTMAIINDFTDGLMVFNREDVLEIANPKIEKFFGIAPEEVSGKTLSALGKIEKLKSLQNAISQSPDFNKSKKNSEDEGYFRKEILAENNITVEISTVPVFQDGIKMGTLVVIHDISREKMVEAMKSEFVSIAAHQLRTPLSAMKWTVKMLLDEDLGKLNEDQRGLVDKAYISTERMVRLINDLLNVSRIEEGRYLYKPSHVEVRDILTPLIDSYKVEMKRRGVDFKINIPEEKPLKIAADTEKISLVVQNFLDNAMKYTPKGGEVVLTMTPKPENKTVEISVKDSGVGIPKDQQRRLFSKFFRAANVIRMETEGSGLGLFICKNIVEAHKGKVWFESEEGKGSTFYFSIPVIETKKGFEEFIKKL